jgi:uncharacterized coiled-coil protein SlyX
MPNEPWHMSKSVPISFIFAIVMQTVALVWFVSSLNSSVEANAKELVRHETRLSSLESVVQTQAITLARLDENIRAIRSAVEKMANESP